MLEFFLLLVGFKSHCADVISCAGPVPLCCLVLISPFSWGPSWLPYPHAEHTEGLAGAPDPAQLAPNGRTVPLLRTLLGGEERKEKESWRWLPLLCSDRGRGPRWYPRSLPMGFRPGFLLRELLLIAALLCCIADQDQMSRRRFL